MKEYNTEDNEDVKGKEESWEGDARETQERSES